MAKWREVPKTLDAISLIEFCRDHRVYLEVRAQLMGFETGIVYRVFEQKEKFFAPEIDHSVQLAAYKVLNDIEGLGIWGNWENSYNAFREQLKAAINENERKYPNESLDARLIK